MLRRIRAEDGGFTLVELLVVVLILGVVGGYTLTGLVQGMQTTDRLDARIQTFSDLQRSSERVSRDLRRGVWSDTSAMTLGTPPPGCTYVAMNPNDLTLIIFVGGQRQRHRYTLSDGTLRLETAVWNEGTSSWSASTSSTVATGLVNAAAGIPLFGYLDAAGVDLLQDGLQNTDRRSIRKFRLSLVGDVRDQDPVEITTVVTARNGGLPCPIA